MENTKDRASLSAEASLVLETLEAVFSGSPLTIKIAKSPEHPMKVEAACNELAQGGQIKEVSKTDFITEYRFG